MENETIDIHIITECIELWIFWLTNNLSFLFFVVVVFYLCLGCNVKNCYLSIIKRLIIISWLDIEIPFSLKRCSLNLHLDIKFMMVRLYFLPYILSIYNVVSSTVLNYITMFMLNIVFGISGFDAECFVSMLGDVWYVCIFVWDLAGYVSTVKLHNQTSAHTTFSLGSHSCSSMRVLRYIVPIALPFFCG